MPSHLHPSHRMGLCDPFHPPSPTPIPLAIVTMTPSTPLTAPLTHPPSTIPFSLVTFSARRPFADPDHWHWLPDVLQKRTTNNALKAHTVNYLRTQTKSFEYTRKVLLQIYTQAEEEVNRLGGNKLLEKILEKLGVPEGDVSGEVMEGSAKWGISVMAVVLRCVFLMNSTSRSSHSHYGVRSD